MGGQEEETVVGNLGEYVDLAKTYLDKTQTLKTEPPYSIFFAVNGFR